MHPEFIHLHVHSYYSFFDSTLSPGQIVDFAVSQGMSHIALTDTNTFTGIMEFNLLCRGAGISPILGAEIRQPLPQHRKLLKARAWKFRSDEIESADVLEYQDQGHEKISASPMLWHGDMGCRGVLLAKSFQGYSNISRILTRRHLDSNFDLTGEITGLPESVILLSDCTSILETAHKAGVMVYGQIFPSPRCRRRNRMIYEFCISHNIPLVMAADAKLLDAEDRQTHHLLRAMGTLTTVDNLPGSEKIDPSQYLATTSVIRDFFGLDRPVLEGLESYRRHLDEAYNNTHAIAALCNCELPYRNWQFPRLNLDCDAGALLDDLTWKGIRWRYGAEPSEEVFKRTHSELSVIKNLKFTEYFVLVKQIIDEAGRREYFTIGRGSAANSIVTYALGISNVCPVKYNLYFERFLNPERSSPPDIDLDFSWRERDEMIDWCFEHFGRENVALISTVPTLKYRQAIREVGKALGIPPGDIDHFNRLSETGYRVEEDGRMRDYSREEPWCTILQTAERIQGFPHHLSVHCGGVVIAPFPVTDYMPLTLSAKGYAITQMDMLGVEDLGLVKMDLLGNRSLGVLTDALRMGNCNGGRNYDMIRATPGDEPEKDPSQRDQVFQREASRMKLAGTRRGTSVALAGALHNLEGQESDSLESYHRSLKERVLDFTHVTNDTWTKALIDAGQTMGCFYIESPGMRALFERLRCKSYEEVVVASSIIRPGVAESGMMKEYIDRHQETRLPVDLRSPLTMLPPENGSNRMAAGNLPLNAHSKAKVFEKKSGAGNRAAPPTISKVMQEMLPETHGVMVYQEDVLKVAHDLAGMSFSEADLLRRAISGKLRSSENILKVQTRFVEGCKSHSGLSADETEEIWRQLSSFAGYSFCKGHSAAFAVLSYQVAYLKAHYPAEFFAAVLTNQGGFYGAGAYIEEARRWGVGTKYPCVNESEIEYTGKTTWGEPVTGALLPGDNSDRGWIRPGLRFIGGLTAHGMNALLDERGKDGSFVSFEDFLSRCPIYDDDIMALIRSGACDCFWPGIAPETSRARALLETSLWKSNRGLNRDTLFDFDDEPAAVPGFNVEPFRHLEICQMEREHLGCMISGHPLDFVNGIEDAVSACDIKQWAGKKVTMVGWGIGAKVLAAKNNRKPMKMLTLEDRTGTFEAIMFPRIYQKFSTRTLTKGPYVIRGEVDVSLGSPTLNVRSIDLLKSLQDLPGVERGKTNSKLSPVNTENHLRAQIE